MYIYTISNLQDIQVQFRGRTLDISKHIYHVSTLYLTSIISRLRGRTLESLAEDTLQCGHQGEAARSQGDTCSNLQQEVLYPHCTAVNITAVNITAAAVGFVLLMFCSKIT